MHAKTMARFKAEFPFLKELQLTTKDAVYVRGVDFYFLTRDSGLLDVSHTGYDRVIYVVTADQELVVINEIHEVQIDSHREEVGRIVQVIQEAKPIGETLQSLGYDPDFMVVVLQFHAYRLVIIYRMKIWKSILNLE